jgi:deoxyadenosine/deoxycytidine kinase
MKALIDDGKFSGKPEFVYYITKSDWSEIAMQLIKDGGYFEIDITEQEYNYIKNVDNCIDVFYNKFGKTLEEKFYY